MGGKSDASKDNLRCKAYLPRKRGSRIERAKPSVSECRVAKRNARNFKRTTPCLAGYIEFQIENKVMKKIKDIRSWLAAGCLLMACNAFAITPSITNVMSMQRYPWNNKVDISFTLTGDMAAEALDDYYAVLTVTALDLSSNKNYIADPNALSGDTGTSAGNHHVVWDLSAQGVEFKSENVVFMVGYKKVPYTYCVVDLSAGSNAVSYPVSYMTAPPAGGFNRNEYKTTKLVLRRIEPGTFRTIGTSGECDITLTESFYCCIFEVTQRQYELVTGQTPSFNGDMFPVGQVSYDMLKASDSFLGRINVRTKLKFDLPTQVQWEYACRAGTTTTYYWGDSMNGNYAWYSGNSDGKTHVVGTRTPNAWGLYDMCGNVSEWCLDRYSFDGSIWQVTKGGSYNEDADSCTSSQRIGNRPSYNYSDNGFRLVKPISNVNDMFCSGDSAPVAIDCRMNIEPVLASVVLSWDASWIGGDADAVVVILDNGVEVKRTSGTGSFTHVLAGIGPHELSYTTYVNGVAQSEVYTVNVYAQWKYKIEDGGLIITEAMRTTESVPHSINGFPVTKIADGAFAGCTNMTSVTMPNSVTSIGVRAFAGCTGITNVAIPDGVEYVGYEAFASCPAVTNVVLPCNLVTDNGILSANNWTLTAENADGTAEYTVKAGSTPFSSSMTLTLVGPCEYTFGWKTPAPSSVLRWYFDGEEKASVDYNTIFWKNVSVSVPAGEHTITWAFSTTMSGCLGMVVIPRKKVRWRANVLFPDSYMNIQYLTLTGEARDIPDYAFEGCAALASADIPSSVTNIGVSAFAGCSGLTSVVIPESVERLAPMAFLGCASLTEVTIPCKFLDAFNFISNDWTLLSMDSNGKDEYKSAPIGNIASTTMSLKLNVQDAFTFTFDWKVSSESFHDYLKWYLDGVQKGSIHGTNQTWRSVSVSLPVGEHTITWTYAKDAAKADGEDCGWVRFSRGEILDGGGRVKVADIFPASYSRLTFVTLSGSATEIPDGAFEGCADLRAINVPLATTNIGAFAFADCKSLTNVTMPNSVTSVGNSAFQGCAGLEILAISDSVTSIGRSAFQGCTGLERIVIPSSVSNVGKEAFKDCAGLRYVEVARGLKEMLESRDVFAGCSQELEIVYISAEIQNVTAKQQYPWDAKIDVSYTIRGDIAALARERGYSVNSLTVTAVDMETHTTNAVATLSGDTWLAEGPHTFVWDMGAQGVSLASGNVVFSIECNRTPIPIRYCVIDLSAGANATSYPVTYLDEPPTGGFNTDEYKTTKLVLRRIDNGSFVMGGGCNVTLTRPFYCSIFEVTQKQYALVMGDNPSHYEGDTRPVDNVSWNMIRGDSSMYNWPSSSSVDPSTFIGKIQARTGLAFDLPTEAQWEYACRAGTTSEYNNGGNLAEDMDLLGRYSGNTSDGNGGYAQYTVVGSYAPNAWGLYDMHGNVWEWCLDWYYGELPASATDPVGSSTGSYRVMRGGNYLESAEVCTSSYRNGYNPSYEGTRVIGIRLVRTMSSVHDAGVRYEKESEGVEVAVYERHDGGSAQWQLDEHISHGNDSWSLRSGAIGDNQESWFEMTVPRAGRLSFWWKASSEWDGDWVFDYAYLSIDGVPQGSLITENDVYQLEGVSIGGDADWRQVVVDIPGNGEHVVRWTYKKDEVDEGETGEDCAWVDDIDFAPLVSAGFALGGGMGSLPASIEGIYGSVVTLPSQSGFAREDYVFDGWSDGNRTYRGGSGFIMPYNDVALTAQWTRKTFLSFDLGGGIGVVLTVVKELEGTNVTLPTQSGFEWQDHVFDGWSDGTTTYAGGSQYCMPLDDVTLTAQWIAKRFLTFKLDGGAGNVPSTLKDIPGAIVTLPSAEGFAKSKHTFVGWSDGSEVYEAEAEYCVTEDNLEFKAVWRRHELTVSITSADVANGGVISTQGATITIGAQADPSGGQPTVYYTLDGSTPTRDSIKYVSPFVADDMSVMVKAIAVMDDYFDSNVAEFSFSRLPYSPAECIGVSGVDVSTGGDVPWNRVTGGETLSGIAALRSGAIGDGGSSWVEMIVDGPGEVSFWGKISSQNKVRTNKHDYLALVVDGVETLTLGGGTIDWTNLVYAVVGIGSHSLKWVYIKDSDGITNGNDCAWLDTVIWAPDSSIPRWSIIYENLKGAANPNPSKYYEGYAVTFLPPSGISGYTFAGWIPGSISADETGDKVVTANWNWIPQDAVVEASITGGKALTVDAEWVKTELDQVFGAGRQQLFIDKFGDDFAAALAKKTGKRDGAGNELAVWHDYVAGTDPTDVNSIFKAKIEIMDGMPVIEWEPNLNSNGETRVYTVYGKAKLADAWHSPTNALDHFFKVDVTMPQSGTVTFNVGGGSPVDPIVIRVGQPIGDLPTPTRQGYDFLGWFTEPEGGTEITPETIVTDDMAIFAHWEKRLAADLVHRWSFNGDLTDSVGGQTATKVGNVTAGAEQYTLAGGSNGSSYINLGSNVLPNDGSPVTLEIWATHLSVRNYSRMFTVMHSIKNSSFGGKSDEFSLCWDGDADVICRIASNWYIDGYLKSYGNGIQYHISAVFMPLANGDWQVVLRKKNSITGETLGSYTKTFSQSDWTLQIQPQTYCMLGHVNGDSAQDANASYNELRIWKKAMTEEELTASAIAGPDADL